MMRSGVVSPQDGGDGDCESIVSIIVPVYNEAESIGLCLWEISEAMTNARLAYQLIVVDDGSHDGTLDVISKCEISSMVLVRNKGRMGSGFSRRNGLRFAVGKFVAWIDGDGTYAADDLVALIHQLRCGDYDQVIGRRSCDHGSLRWLRLFVKRMICLVASLAWWRLIPDLNSGLRVFRREALLSIENELPQGFSCASTATLASYNRGYRMMYYPIHYRARRFSRSKFHPFMDTVRLLKVVWCQRLRGWNRTRENRSVDGSMVSIVDCSHHKA